MTLRSRLTLLTVGLFAVGLVVMAVVTFLLVRTFLVDRLDEQLDARGGRGAAAVAFGRDFESPRPGAPFLRNELVVLVLDEQGREVGSLPEAADLPDLPSHLPGSAEAADASAATFSAGSGASHYRMLARQRQDAPGTVVLALPLAEVDSTLRRLLLIEAVVGGIVLLGMAALMRSVLGAGLRPLERIAATADDIAAGNLSQRVDPAGGGSEVELLGTAFNEMLERLEVSFQEQRETEELLRRFVADASHELRTPLTSIRGYAELTRRFGPDQDEARRQAMARIEEEAVRMSALVEDLLLLARLDRGRGHVSEPVDLAQLARDVVDAARELDPDRPLEVVADGEAVVEGDSGRLRQVLANLVGNVRTHTPPGTVASVRVWAANGSVRVEVHDGGPGIAASDQERLFDRFYRADSARTRETGGSGLGLSIVKSIVEAHDGDITVRSTRDSGTTFTVTLPGAGQVD